MPESKVREVRLAYQDLVLASTNAAMRQSKAIRRNVVGKDHGSSSKRKVCQRLADKVLGELGELALAQELELPKTSTKNPFGRGDVAEGFEVRATEHQNGHLLVYDSDPDARFFLAVIQWEKSEIRVSLPGWILASNARQDRFWRDADPGCYWIPQSELNPI